MQETIQTVDKLHYKTVTIPKLTRGIASDSTELIGNTPLVRLNRLTAGLEAGLAWVAANGIRVDPATGDLVEG